MNDFISHVLAAIERDGAEMKAVFPGLAGLTVVYKFAERLANDVVSSVMLLPPLVFRADTRYHTRLRSTLILYYLSVDCFHKSCF